MRLAPGLLAALVSLSVIPQAAIDVNTPVISTKNRQKDFKSATLSLDDTARRTTVNSKELGRIEVQYDGIQKVIIEPHFRATYNPGAALAGFALGGAALGGRIAESIDNPADMAHSVYLEYKDAQGSTIPLLLTLDKKNVPMALKQIKAAFGDKVSMPAFTEVPQKLEVKELATAKTKFVVKGNVSEHPMPTIQSDKALVVVACPTGNGLDAISLDKFQRWGAYLVLRDKVLAVTAPGAYTFFYVEPGEHLLISQAMDANGLPLKVEAGKDYYLMQTMYIAGKIKSFLTRSSKELVMHEIKNLVWSEWKPAE